MTRTHPYTLGWDPDSPAVLVLPDDRVVRGRPLRTPPPAGPPPTFAVRLGLFRPAPEPWPTAWIAWPDFGVPLHWPTAAAVLRQAYAAAGTGRVEIGCFGGRGRTGTALACLATCCGLSAESALHFVRQRYHPKAAEMAWQSGFVSWFAGRTRGSQRSTA